MLTVTNPKALQWCVFFYAGKCFYIRDGQGQRALGLANFKFVVYPGDDPNYVCTYVEHGSKNRCGGLGDHRVKNKKVPRLGARENILKCL